MIQEDNVGHSSSDEDNGVTKDILNKMNFENPSVSNILNEEQLDEALESFQKMTTLKKID